METVIIDLKKNPDVAEVIRGMEPGDALDLHTSIKAMDDQTLTVTVRQASLGKPFDEEDEQDPDPDEGDAVTAPGESMDGSQAGAGPDAMGMTGGEAAAT